MGRTKKEPKTGIFEPEDDGIVYKTIERLRDRAVTFHCQNDLTEKDLLELFVPANLHELARRAVTDLDCRMNRRFEIGCPKGPNVEVHCDVSGFSFNRIYVNSSASGYAKVMAWREQRLEIGRQWGLVKAVYDMLRVRCSRKDYVRYWWPPIVTLLGNSETASALEAYKPVSNPSPISPQLRRACVETMEIVTMGMLLPTEEPPERLVTLSMGGMPMAKAPWEEHPRAFSRM